MTLIPISTAPLTLRFSTPCLFIMATLLTSILLSGCSSTCNKSLRIARIADQQLAVIESVKREREAPEVSGLAKKNATLWRAEQHLSAALGALERAVLAIKQEEGN